MVGGQEGGGDEYDGLLHMELRSIVEEILKREARRERRKDEREG